jgi:sRNA-binding carbon storage regulator CsrA
MDVSLHVSRSINGGHVLVLTRKPRQTILIQPALWLPRDITAGELFGAGGVGVVVTRVMDKEVRLGVAADRRFVVWRGELAGWEGGG